MRYEIGSHFESDKKIIGSGSASEWLPRGKDYTYTFSGRTAIEIAIKDVMKNKRIETVYMPSYCCYSMIEPFIKHNIKVIYYDVTYGRDGIEYNVNFGVECDVFFALTYFGLEDPKEMDSIIRRFSNQGRIVFEDITHRLLSESSHSNLAHYSIASLRKWFPVYSGGYIIKHNDLLDYRPEKQSEGLIINRKNAMKKKHDYLQGKSVNKEMFLDLFALAEQQLAKTKDKQMVDNESNQIIEKIDIDYIRTRRRSNSRLLYKGISNLKLIKPLIPKPDINLHCPLFVPVIVGRGKRDNLRKYLIEHNIYCPVHWPQNKININTTIPEVELSLICDHRYNSKDMKYILNLLKEWEENL